MPRSSTGDSRIRYVTNRLLATLMATPVSQFLDYQLCSAGRPPPPRHNALISIIAAWLSPVIAIVWRMSLSQREPIPPAVYFASVPRKRMAAGALFRDGRGNILLVDPVYRDTWDLPGGVIDADESPNAACRREVAEEIGLAWPAGRLLVVDWVPAQTKCPEELVLIYDGGVLGAAAIAAITVTDAELAGFAFFAPGQVDRRVRPVVGRRIRACLQALATGRTAELEDGEAIRAAGPAVPVARSGRQ
jgi:8-oxo-dGTP diphosphatase